MEEESNILLAFSRGDATAFEHIYNRFYVIIYIEAHRYIKSEEDAKDIRSKCFIKLWELRERLEFDSMGALFSWLRTTASNSCIDLLRNAAMRESKETDIIKHYWQQDAFEVFEASEKEAIIIERLLKKIEELPTNIKKVFKMRWLSDLKFREIAEQLGADVSTIKKRYARALTLLKK